MAQGGPLTARIRISVAISETDGCTWVFVSRPAKDNYRLILPTQDVRAIAAALAGEIDAHPDRFPVTDTRRVDQPPPGKPC